MVMGVPITWFANLSTTKTMVIMDTLLSSNGGSINHNRVMRGQFYAADAAKPPTANSESSITSANLSNASPNPDVLGFRWDGVGNGMVMPAGSVLGLGDEALCGQGIASIADEATVLPPGCPTAFFHTCDGSDLAVGETGLFACTFTLMLIDPDQL